MVVFPSIVWEIFFPIISHEAFILHNTLLHIYSGGERGEVIKRDEILFFLCRQQLHARLNIYLSQTLPILFSRVRERVSWRRVTHTRVAAEKKKTREKRSGVGLS